VPSGDGGPCCGGATAAAPRRCGRWAGQSFHRRYQSITACGKSPQRDHRHHRGIWQFRLFRRLLPRHECAACLSPGRAVDGTGNVFVADSANTPWQVTAGRSDCSRLRRVDAASQSAMPISPRQNRGRLWTGLALFDRVCAPGKRRIRGSGGWNNGDLQRVSPAPLIYSLAGQISAITPYEVTGSTAQIGLVSGANLQPHRTRGGGGALPLTANESGIGLAAAINNVDGSYNTAANPVQVGSLHSALRDWGRPDLSAVSTARSPHWCLPLPAPVLPVQVTVGGVPATIAYAGAAPGSVAGLMQVDVLDSRRYSTPARCLSCSRWGQLPPLPRVDRRVGNDAECSVRAS